MARVRGTGHQVSTARPGTFRSRRVRSVAMWCIDGGPTRRRTLASFLSRFGKTSYYEWWWSNCVTDDGWTSAVTSTFQWNIRAKRRATESSLLPRVYAKRTFIRNKLNLCALSLWCCLVFKLAPMHISPGQHRNTSRTLMAGTHRSSQSKHAL